MDTNRQIPQHNDFNNLRKLLRFFPESCHFRLHGAHHVKTNPYWGFKNRVNQDQHLIYVIDGKGCYHLKEESETLERGKVIFVSAGSLHTAVPDAEDPPFIIPLRLGIYSNHTGKMMALPISPFTLSLQTSAGSTHRQRFETVYRLFCSEPGHLRTIELNLVIQEILLAMLVDHQQDPAVDSRIEKIKQYILNHPATRKTPAELATLSGLSTKYFARLFREQVGRSPTDFCIHTRCRYAEYLLQNTNRRIKAIAYDLGYPDPYAFSKQFKKVTGHSPNKVQSD